jgi:hypothetical protein
MDVKFSDDLRILTCKGILLDGIGGLKVAGRGGDRRDLDVHDFINSRSPMNISRKLATKDKDCHSDEIGS